MFKRTFDTSNSFCTDYISLFSTLTDETNGNFRGNLLRAAEKYQNLLNVVLEYIQLSMESAAGDDQTIFVQLYNIAGQSNIN